MTGAAKTPLLLIGGGGHCAALIDVIESTQQYQIVGIVEAAGVIHADFMGYPVVGTDEDLPALLKQTPNCVISVGQLKTSVVRQKLYQQVLDAGGQLPVIISPLAHIAKQAQIGDGTVVMHYALVNSMAKIEENCIINSYALVEHGTNVAAHCHLATRSTLNGDCRIEQGCFIGSGAVVLQGRSVAASTIVGAGAVVAEDILQSGTYVGVPAHLITANTVVGE